MISGASQRFRQAVALLRLPYIPAKGFRAYPQYYAHRFDCLLKRTYDMTFSVQSKRRGVHVHTTYHSCIYLGLFRLYSHPLDADQERPQIDPRAIVFPWRQGKTVSQEKAETLRCKRLPNRLYHRYPENCIATGFNGFGQYFCLAAHPFPASTPRRQPAYPRKKGVTSRPPLRIAPYSSTTT